MSESQVLSGDRHTPCVQWNLNSQQLLPNREEPIQQIAGTLEIDMRAGVSLRRKPVVVDLFCGAGGMSLGFQMAGYHIGLGFESELLPYRTHSYNFGDHCHLGDITGVTVPAATVTSHGIGRVDVIIGGPPCQGFSRVGRGKMRSLLDDSSYIHDPRNQYYKEFIRFVKALKPLYFVMENVPDMQNYSDGEGLLIEKMVGHFKEIGYDAKYDVLRADHYGVPQTRKRLFIIGKRRELTQAIAWPDRTHEGNPVTVWEALST